MLRGLRAVDAVQDRSELLPRKNKYDLVSVQTQG